MKRVSRSGPYVPRKLFWADEDLYEIAVAQDSQEDADDYIRIEYPEWEWADLPHTVRGVKGDQQAAGSYSLHLCMGGGKYHEVSPDERGSSLTPNRVTGGVATVPEVKGMPKPAYPKGTRRLAGYEGAMWIPGN